MNYVDHCKEVKTSVPEVPVIFNKFSTSLCASGDPIRLPPPSITSQVDYEVELAVIVSKRLSHSDQAEFAANPLDFIGGYCVRSPPNASLPPSLDGMPSRHLAKALCDHV
eukprot:scaffold1637_cov410-Prasinococcus_capsulatus_cf.AAC.3